MAKLTSIVQEMGRDVWKKLNRTQAYAEPIEICLLALNIIPTGIRYFNEGEDISKDFKRIGALIGATLNVAGYGTLIVQTEKLQYLLIPLATNAASLIYEWGRNASQRIESKRVYH